MGICTTCSTYVGLEGTPEWLRYIDQWKIKWEKSRNIERRQNLLGHIIALGLCPKRNGNATIDITKEEYTIRFAFERYC